MKKIFIGTNNQGKLCEFSDAFRHFPIEITYPDKEGLTADIKETGTTFTQNALLKAGAWTTVSKLPTLVDDSGLCVDALDGKPGVLSARFFPGSDTQRNQKLLELLKAVPFDQRTAHYTCVIAFIDPNTGIEKITEGTCKGHILLHPQGEGGFGYDPIFQPVGFNNSFGELPLEIKQRISHRAKALALMAEFLREWSR